MGDVSVVNASGRHGAAPANPGQHKYATQLH